MYINTYEKKYQVVYMYFIEINIENLFNLLIKTSSTNQSSMESESYPLVYHIGATKVRDCAG